MVVITVLKLRLRFMNITSPILNSGGEIILNKCIHFTNITVVLRDTACYDCTNALRQNEKIMSEAVLCRQVLRPERTLWFRSLIIILLHQWTIWHGKKYVITITLVFQIYLQVLDNKFTFCFPLLYQKNKIKKVLKIFHF